ncbi:SusC/RagA family TonB-linked outer membrane protein [Chitinophaga sancti]|uniref:Iron complex outermembrane recepter protein n=1 Tax=Chitinophaga sancti TaxID=1004 RepID=A0A1K1PGZ8_9BACT|nr:SusC/RagA family TonB-linked outer membrane protein [Chitinophaga sancti]WQD65895.1 SusC/RagA family TonB-linked outer membrane protein [Chitinophaga sancti]WQG88483.1 SusC/RagA family TonB-linked outer membrane protein [Chitinophaga sancti]SFW46745.1 iron complex outermembrane recepter protein [Chitinophaga sancti]
MSFYVRPRGVKIPYGLLRPLLILQLTLGFILFLNLHVVANVLSSKTITLNLRSVEFKEVLSIIEHQSDYRFMFSNRNIPNKSKVDINVKDAQINTVMDMILDNSGYTYQELANNLIVIVPRGERITTVKITGKVLDQTGEALIGASVKIKGTSDGVATDENGGFTLSVPDDAILVVSYVGFKTQEVPVNGKTALTITLQPADKMINEFVVTALGIKREEKALGYAVSTITSEQINAAGNTNFASALYGKAAGVKITTAPGGATSAVNIQIRGVNSLNYSTQPLYVVDGVQIRNNNESGGVGGNNGGYWDDPRIRGNGILDINPADIENLTVLKGASATALYGSDASSGVVVITTKKGQKGRGLGVDVNYSTTRENIANQPQYQNTYGPGYYRALNVSNGSTEDGWVKYGNDGTLRPYFRAWGQFGPKMDGQMVPWWDGSMHPFSPQPNNYKQMFQKGYNSSLNVSLSNMNEKANYRFSYTRSDYKGIQIGTKQGKNTFNLNSTIKLHSKVSLDVVGGYVNTTVTNRARLMNRLFDSFDGFFSRAEDMAVVFDKYKTSKGYKWVPYDNTQLNPDEALVFNIRPELLNFLWYQLKNNEVENQDRLLSSVTLNVDLAKGLKLRARVGNDFTSINTEEKEYNEYPIAFNTTQSTGKYVVTKNRYAIVYTDLLATYANDQTKVFGYSISGGFQSRQESFTDQQSVTNGGLVTANWFSLSNSYAAQTTSEGRSKLLKYAFLGIANFSYKNYLFLEGTARQESSSTLPPASNTYFYPSVNSSFIFTDAFELPKWLSYGKIRASYGMVGNAPPPYESNILYTQKPLSTTTGSVPVLTAQNAYGNANLKSEKKTEMEFGIETKIFQNRIGVDISVYNSKVRDLLMRLSTAASNGALTRITNVGELNSKGLEIAFSANPLKRPKTNWNTRMNFAFNNSKVVSLADGVDQITFSRNGDSYSLKVVAEKGQTIGNLYMYPLATDEKGNKLVNDLGMYYVDKSKYVKAGNILPKVVGGWSNTFSYKSLTLDLTIDYRFGGEIMSMPQKYGTAAGMWESTLKYRDEAHGGLPYYVTAQGVYTQLPGHNSVAPYGKTYHDGVILPGKMKDGTDNTKIVQAAEYYYRVYTADNSGYNGPAVMKNSYIKFREAVLSYNLSRGTAMKLHMQNIRLSLIGRNLFYFYRTLKNLDPETTVGQSWINQGIDEGSTGATRSIGFSLNASF